MGCGLFALAVEAQAVWSIITLVGRVLAAKVSRNPEPVVGTEVLEQARYDFVAGPIRRPFSETLADGITGEERQSLAQGINLSEAPADSS
jgi:hypothetical protein